MRTPAPFNSPASQGLLGTRGGGNKNFKSLFPQERRYDWTRQLSNTRNFGLESAKADDRAELRNHQGSPFGERIHFTGRPPSLWLYLGRHKHHSTLFDKSVLRKPFAEEAEQAVESTAMWIRRICCRPLPALGELLDILRQARWRVCSRKGESVESSTKNTMRFTGIIRTGPKYRQRWIALHHRGPQTLWCSRINVGLCLVARDRGNGGYQSVVE